MNKELTKEYALILVDYLDTSARNNVSNVERLCGLILLATRTYLELLIKDAK